MMGNSMFVTMYDIIHVNNEVDNSNYRSMFTLATLKSQRTRPTRRYICSNSSVLYIDYISYHMCFS